MSISTNDDRLTYNSWNNMRNRCRSTKLLSADDYIGRGITVCDRWLGPDGYENFRTDMGPRPSKAHSIDRIDNDKGYSPDNCRWATRDVQSQNRRKYITEKTFDKNVDTLEYKGMVQSYAQWLKASPDPELTVRKLRQRIAANWPVGEALGFEPHKIKREYATGERKQPVFKDNRGPGWPFAHDDPEIVAKRHAGIRAFYDKLKSDPELRAEHYRKVEEKKAATRAAKAAKNGPV